MHQPVQHFVEGDDRNTKPGLFDKVPLDGIDPLGGSGVR